MTATTLSDARVASTPAFGRFAGLGPLTRKDVTEWARGRRAWIVAASVSLFMVLTAANGWITKTIAEGLPPGVEAPEIGSQVPFDNLAMAAGTQMFVIAAIFAVASLLVREREAGTLAWVASKPVTRSSIWLAKWLSASALLVVSAVLVPMIASTVLVTALYGVPPVIPVVGLTLGMAFGVVFFVAVGLAAGTFVPSQPAVAAIGLGALIAPPSIAGLLPADVMPILPNSIVGWAAATASGAPAGFVTPIAWAVATGGLVALAIHRMRRLEL